jgi:hypothetical protein
VEKKQQTLCVNSRLSFILRKEVHDEIFSNFCPIFDWLW